MSNLSVSTHLQFFFLFLFILSITIPICFCLYHKKRTKVKLKFFFWGVLTYFISVLVLESIFNSIFISNIKNTLYFIILGAISASCFECSGKIIAIKRCIRKEKVLYEQILMYIIGYIGAELFFVYGIGMLNNFIYSVLINGDYINEIIKTSPSPEQTENFLSICKDLSTVTSLDIILSLFERIISIITQICFTYLIWFFISNKEYRNLYIPFLLHFLSDFLFILIYQIFEKQLLALIVGCFVSIIYILLVKKYKKRIKLL